MKASCPATPVRDDTPAERPPRGREGEGRGEGRGGSGLAVVPVRAGASADGAYDVWMAEITGVSLTVGLEIHVELSTRTKMFTRAPNPAHPAHDGAAPNTLIDPVVVALPGALPVMNERAIDLSIMVGLALGCSIAPLSVWDRKSYFYPDLPKGYQISQYALPLCFDGAMDVPPANADGTADFDGDQQRIGIIRAHLEEDTGKLLHEAPGGRTIPDSILDLNRAGTPLLEIVTAPDFTDTDRVVVFAQMLRNICRFLDVTEGVMQRGHMRFEPNINTTLLLDDGRSVKTPIVEVKNLNSFRALRGAIEYELREQPARWLEDGREMGPGAKTTRGWDDTRMVTLLQREKEDAHDYRYFPDPDLLPVRVDAGRLERIRAGIPELPAARAARYRDEYGLSPKDAAALTGERDLCLFFEAVVRCASEDGVDVVTSGKLGANMLLQSGLKRSNETGTPVPSLGITAAQVAGIVALRSEGSVSASNADTLFGLLTDPEDDRDPGALADASGMRLVTDTGALEGWCREALAAHPEIAADVRAGKQQAVGRLIGAVMQASGGSADAKAVRAMLIKMIDGD